MVRPLGRCHALRGASLVAILCCSCATFLPPRDEDCAECRDPHGVQVCDKPTVRALAADLDHLERHIETFGSVVAKTPDVWGEARLTKYRQEFESEMASNFKTFSLSLQGSLARSDQAFFANSFALSAAIQPRRTGSSVVVNAPTPAPIVVTGRTTTTTTGDKDKAGTTTSTTEGPAPVPAAPSALSPVAIPTLVGDATSGLEHAVLRPTDASALLPTVSAASGALGFSSAGLSIEPTEFLAQKARYLNCLNQFRRTNEGDDTADSPGYSLNLFNIPMSLLPGKRTDVGYGAEATCTLTPVLGDDLLPTTFRNLIVNDIVKHLGYPLAIVLNDDDMLNVILSPEKGADTAADLLLRHRLGQAGTIAPAHFAAGQIGQPTTLPSDEKPPAGVLPFRPLASTVSNSSLVAGTRGLYQLKSSGTPRSKGKSTFARANTPPAANVAHDWESMDDVTLLKTPLQFIEKFTANSARLAGPASKSKRARSPFPASQLYSVYGNDFCYRIAHSGYKAFNQDIEDKGYAHLPDIRSYLQEEVAAAYKFLSTCENEALWHFCTPELACAVRTHNFAYVREARWQYFEVLANRPDPLEAKSLSAALGWAILIEAALLNEQLVRDMHEASSAKSGAAHPSPALPYFLPCPPPEARKAFNDYVALRWPIHVFALDPAVEEQNISDALTTRRETQLALSLAFASGNISANNFTKFARRLDAQYETIALNRTQVGFSHGDDTFGWRFYPRFQSPDTESNLKVLARDQLIGGPNRDALLRQRRLEPGPRECVAVVLMPSFVPYLNCDVCCNWFRLDNPKHKELDSRDAMRLSRSVKAIQTCSGKVTDGECYRDGDLHRLQRKAEQLSARLPLQTLSVQVPYENTLGGFEMFNAGVTDLAPELYGWYGAPGIDVDSGGATTLFLIGDHFSVNQTWVIAGNRECNPVTLLSRQVAMVLVPNNVLVRSKPDDIEIQVATPYGVTQTIAVPAIRTKKAEDKLAAEGFSVKPTALTVNYTLMGDGKDKFCPMFDSLNPKSQKVKILWSDALGATRGQIAVQFEFAYNGSTITVPHQPIVLADGKNGEFTLSDEDTSRMIVELMASIFSGGPKSLADNPLNTKLKTTKIVVTPDSDSKRFATQTVAATNQLEIEFKSRLVPGTCSPGPVAVPSIPASTPTLTPPPPVGHPNVPCMQK